MSEPLYRWTWPCDSEVRPSGSEVCRGRRGYPTEPYSIEVNPEAMGWQGFWGLAGCKRPGDTYWACKGRECDCLRWSGEACATALKPRGGGGMPDRAAQRLASAGRSAAWLVAWDMGNLCGCGEGIEAQGSRCTGRRAIGPGGGPGMPVLRDEECQCWSACDWEDCHLAKSAGRHEILVELQTEMQVML